MPLTANDGFRGLSALLFGAGGRYCSVRASVRHHRRGDLATESINRYEEYGFRRGILHNLDPPYHEPRYSQYGDLNEFLAPLARAARSLAPGDGPLGRIGHRLPRRRRRRALVVLQSAGSGGLLADQPRGFSADRELSALFDPYELRHGKVSYTVRGPGKRTFRRGSAVGVRATVEAEAVSWDYAPLEPLWEGADDYLLSVEARVGVILRLAFRLRGEEFDAFEVLDTVFDEEFAEGTFRLELPGVQFRRVEDR